MSTEKHTQSIRGTVVKICSANTIRIASKITKVHPLYQKRYSQVRHYLAHDPNNSAKVGDEVTIVACRPISKTKQWILQ